MHSQTMAAPLFVAVLLLATYANSLPISNLGTHTSSNLAIRGEVKSEEQGLSDEAIIGIAAIFVPIILFILTLALPAPRRRIFGCFTGRTQQNPSPRRRRIHRRWYQ